MTLTIKRVKERHYLMMDQVSHRGKVLVVVKLVCMWLKGGVRELCLRVGKDVLGKSKWLLCTSVQPKTMRQFVSGCLTMALLIVC